MDSTASQGNTFLLKQKGSRVTRMTKLRIVREIGLIPIHLKVVSASPVVVLIRHCEPRLTGTPVLGFSPHLTTSGRWQWCQPRHRRTSKHRKKTANITQKLRWDVKVLGWVDWQNHSCIYWKASLEVHNSSSLFELDPLSSCFFATHTSFTRAWQDDLNLLVRCWEKVKHILPNDGDLPW